MTGPEILPFVLAAAGRGWPVFPVTPGGKYPLRGWRWTQNTTTDPETIRAFWGARACNYGIATGPANLVVIDLDTPKAGQRPPPAWDTPGIADGADVFACLWERHAAGEPLPATFTVRTRRGGTHLYYTAPAGIRLGNTNSDRGNGLGWLIDTRAAGGYAVGPGSRVADADGAGTYTVLDPAPAAALPDWIQRLLTEEKTTPQAADAHVRRMLAAQRGTLARYAAAALRGEVQSVVSARESTRNDTLNTAAFALGQLVAGGILPEHLARDALTAAAHGAGLGERETAATIQSGLNAGARHPRGGTP